MPRAQPKQQQGAAAPNGKTEYLLNLPPIAWLRSSGNRDPSRAAGVQTLPETTISIEAASIKVRASGREQLPLHTATKITGDLVARKLPSFNRSDAGACFTHPMDMATMKTMRWPRWLHSWPTQALLCYELRH